MMEDVELLRRYAEERSEEAFAELVRRRVNLVYSVALRQVGGDAHLAEDVTQRVFTDLARKAKDLMGYAVLSGWLYRSAQYAASDVVRGERRRRIREQEAEIMNEISSSPGGPAAWEKSRPLLDEVLGELDAEDRDALALRFFEERSFAQIGAAVRLTEDGARKRVNRGLDKLHGLLARRGVNSTTAALGLALAGQANASAPVGFAATVTTGALAGAAAGGLAMAGSGATAAIFSFMSGAKIAAGVAGILACAAVGVALFETKMVQKAKAAATVLVQERDGSEAKLRELEGKLMAQTQRATAAEADIDQLLTVVKTLETTTVPTTSNAPAGPITHDLVEARYKHGQELARSGQSAQALGEFLWCYDQGMPSVTSYSGVRNSYLLSDILRLGPEALAALRERRDAAQKRMLAGGRDYDATSDFAAINRTLKEDDLTMTVYDQLPVGDIRRKTLASAAFQLLVAQQRYNDAADARNYGSMSSLLEMNIQERPLPPEIKNPESLRQAQRRFTIESTATNVEVLAGAGDLANARKLATRLLTFDGSPETKAVLQQHLARAGQSGLLSENAP